MRVTVSSSIMHIDKFVRGHGDGLGGKTVPDNEWIWQGTHCICRSANWNSDFQTTSSP